VKRIRSDLSFLAISYRNPAKRPKIS